ncbi:glycosyl transferase, group 1 [hydrothermal vent metagenome]|uniref:Glycosyl transferase, group 1 n=1 Tax=hydrothermal vent metagenome TaxID=652676 RepID=A0A1W1EHZ3_9ZZZZ
MIIYIDISNYVETRAHTGIQRVVREFLYRLNTHKYKFDYKVIYYNSKIDKFIIIAENELNKFLYNSKDYTFKDLSNSFAIEDMVKNSIFFDMDGAWNNGLKRNYLYPILKSREIKIYNFIYDLVPIILPQFSHEDTIRNFTNYMFAIYEYSNLVFFDSRSAELDFLKIKSDIQNDRTISTKVVKLGSDVSKQNHKFIEHNLLKTKYILFVGTLEPRKNQELLLKVYESLVNKHSDINLIFIGKAGWNNDKLINKIRTHTLLNKKLFWLENINDDLLIEFYKNAYINVYISSYEGFGLPIAESLSYGNITITSKNSSMYEVGKNFADYIKYNTENELYEIIDLYLDNQELYSAKKEFIKNEYYPYSWDLTYQSIIDVFNNISSDIQINIPKKLQFIFISIDIDNIKRAIAEIDRYIDFVEEYIIITRGDMIDDFKSITSKYNINVVDENEILGEYSKDFSNRDHVSKNWLLRASILKLDNLNKQFIMLDDDNIPLRNISMEHFIKDGKYSAYYFYNLLNWNNFSSDYDLGQHNMKRVLDKDGFELLSYSSHKPQIIDRDIFSEVVDKYFDIGLDMAIDEWSIYFNYAISKYPFLFNKIKFDTLNWPGNVSDWNLEYIPEEYNFENYYSSLYEKDFKNIKSIDKKIKIKNRQQKPYLINQELYKVSSKKYYNYNMIHGVLEFNRFNKKIYLSNIPYFIEAKQGSWIKLPINYKALVSPNDIVEVGYYINDRRGAFIKLYINDNYNENIFDFGISCESLEVGEHNIFIDVVVNNINIYGKESPYLVKLFVR